MFLKISQNSQENTGVSLFFKKEALELVFSCEFCEIIKNTYFIEHLWTTASPFSVLLLRLLEFLKYVDTLITFLSQQFTKPF